MREVRHVVAAEEVWQVQGRDLREMLIREGESVVRVGQRFVSAFDLQVQQEPERVEQQGKRVQKKVVAFESGGLETRVDLEPSKIDEDVLQWKLEVIGKISMGYGKIGSKSRPGQVE